ncbi:type III secretion protein [Pseudomonas sp. SDO5271_S396]
MGDHLAWTQWWAFPWQDAHPDWKGHRYPAICTLFQRWRATPSELTGIEACLPPPPNPTVLRLVLAPPEQLDRTLALVHDTFNPQVPTPFSERDHLWCLRLSKALPSAMLPPGADPLQLLLHWVEPAIWQRLRLRFPRQRVQNIEHQDLPLEHTSSRLSTLWQAVVWRVTTQDGSDVVSTHP